MNLNGLGNVLGNVYQYTNKTQKAATSGVSFTEQLQKTSEAADATKVETYRKYLEQKYGPVTVKDVGKDQRSIDAVGSSTSGYNNVVIAPNILEQMANDQEKAAYYENKIQAGLDNFPKVQAQLSAVGFEIYSYGVGIESDGTVYTYTCGDLKPEVRAKIEAQIKAEREEKAERKQRYLEQSQEAADKRRELMEIQYHKRAMQAALNERSILDTEANYYIAGQSQAVASAVTAYENAVSTYSNSLIENI